MEIDKSVESMFDQNIISLNSEKSEPSIVGINVTSSKSLRPPSEFSIQERSTSLKVTTEFENPLKESMDLNI